MSGESTTTGELVEAPKRILVVDDDIDIARFMEIELRMEGYDVRVAHDGGKALEMVSDSPPDLVLVDVMLPVLGGIELTRRLRVGGLTSAVPIIIISARGDAADKVLGLAEGADDYIVKPFSTFELIARIRRTLQRVQEFRDLSPLTGLPGNNRIRHEIDQRLKLKQAFAVCYCDIDGFKAVNDVYGFARGDEFIVTLGVKLRCAVSEVQGPPAFLGHVGGDDFVVVCDPAQVLGLTDRAVTEFEAAANLLYDAEDYARGYVSVPARQLGAQPKDVGLVTVSIGVALSSRRAYTDARELIADATEMKMVAKTQPGSYVAVDRRKGT